MMGEKLLKKRKSITIGSWNNALVARGDATYYYVYIPGVYLDDGEIICQSASFRIVGVHSNNLNSILSIDVDSLSYVTRTANGIVFAMTRSSTMNVINYGMAIPTSNIVVSVS